MSRKPSYWQGGRLDPSDSPPSVSVKSHHGHRTSTTARDGQLVRCIKCQRNGETT